MATRRERVVLDLETNFPAEAAKAAAAIALLNEEIKHLGGKSSGSPLKTAGKDIEDIGRKADRAAPSINKLTGRLNLMAKGFAVLGPSLIPIGAVGIPAVAGLASQFGFAALAGGTAIAAFQGVGDALKAMNTAALQPTEAHLLAARDAMAQISPTAQQFVRELRTLQPELTKLRDTAAAGLFPGLTSGLEQMSSALPAVERIVGAVAGELGDIADSAGKSLGGARWTDFFDFLQTQAPQALADMASGVGNVAHAMASLWMAFSPLNKSFSSWLVDSTADLDKWASGLSQTAGFQDFVDYVQQNGPQVAATMGAIANAVIQIVEAAAPIGGPVLKGIEGLANAIAKIADSDIGTPLFGMVAAFSALNLAMAAGRSVQGKFLATQGQLTTSFEKQRGSLRSLAADYAAIQRNNKNPQTIFAVGGSGEAERISAVSRETERFRTSLRETGAQAGKAGALVGAFALASTGLGDKLGVSNTIMLAMAGSVIPGYGTAIGAAVGGTIDLAHANDDLVKTFDTVRTALNAGDLTAATDAYAKMNTDPTGLEKAAKLLPVVGTYIASIAGHDRKGKGADIRGLLNADASDRAVDSLVHSLGLLPPSFNLAGSDAATFSAKLTAAREAARTTGQSFVGLGKSVSDSKTSLNGWIQDMAASASALRQFTANSLVAANRGLRQGLISALQQAGPEGAKRMKQLADGTDGQIKRANRAWGAGKAAVRGYTDAIGGVPGSKSTKVSAPGTPQARAQIKAMRDEIARLKDKSVHMNESGSAAARARIAALRAAIASLRDKTVRIGINTVRTTSGSTAPGAGASARGNIFHYAQGDVANRHMPELAGPGPTRMWREPETQGEAYIPLANDSRRPRARSIAMETVGLLGGDPDSVEWFAGGGHHKAKHGAHKGKSNTLKEAIDRLTKSVDAETQSRDDLVSKRNDLASTVSGAFQNDPFASQGSVWSAGGGFNPLGVLKTDTANAKQFGATLAKLRANGVSGQSLAAIASTGNLQQAQQLLAMGAGQDRAYTSAYNQRAAAANAVGAYTGNAVYARDIAIDNAHIRSMDATLKRLEKEQRAHHGKAKEHAKTQGHETGKAINHAATSAKNKKRRHGK